MSNKFNELIELFIAEEQDKAKELFHEIVVEKSRDIYESLLNDEEQVEEEAIDETTDEAIEEADEIDAKIAEVEESDMDEELGGDAADDMIDDIEADEAGLDVAEEDDADEDMEDRVVDLEDALDELKAEFEKLMGDEMGDDGDDEMDMDMDMDMDGEGDDDEEMESVEMEAEEVEESGEEVVREYTEKVADPKGEDHKAASPVAGKNDMGGKAVDPTGEESGRAAPDAKDMGGTTKPDMKKV